MLGLTLLLALVLGPQPTLLAPPEALAAKTHAHLLNVRLFDAERRATELAIAVLPAGAIRDTLAPLASEAMTARAQKLDAQRESLEKELKAAFGGSDRDSIDWSTDPPTLQKAAVKH